MSESIKLGRKMGGSEAYPMPGNPKSDEMHYPEFHIDDLEAELPDEGTMTIRYRKVRETDDKKAGKRSCSVEVLEITGCKSLKKKKSDMEDAEDRLDGYKKEVESE